MSLVVLTGAPGNAGVTTSTVLLAALTPEGQSVAAAECDPSGGDVAGWLSSTGNPSWVTAVAGADRSWEGFARHTQALPSGQRVMLAPSRSALAAVVVNEAAERFAKMLSALSDVVVFADAGRATEVTAWHRLANVVVVVVRQESASVYATVARIDRTIELVGRLQQAGCRLRLLVVGERPYTSGDIAGHVGVELLGSVPDDAPAAALVAGAWSIGKGPGRSRLAKAFRPIAERLVDEVTDPVGVAAGVHAARGPVESTVSEPKDVR